MTSIFLLSTREPFWKMADAVEEQKKQGYGPTRKPVPARQNSKIDEYNLATVDNIACFGKYVVERRIIST